MLAESCFYFESKEYAMENCLEIFGPGLSLGHHIVKGRADKALLAKALEKLDG